jgi:hypothetical protein
MAAVADWKVLRWLAQPPGLNRVDFRKVYVFWNPEAKWLDFLCHLIFLGLSNPL